MTKMCLTTLALAGEMWHHPFNIWWSLELSLIPCQGFEIFYHILVVLYFMFIALITLGFNRLAMVPLIAAGPSDVMLLYTGPLKCVMSCLLVCLRHPLACVFCDVSHCSRPHFPHAPHFMMRQWPGSHVGNTANQINKLTSVVWAQASMSTLPPNRIQSFWHDCPLWVHGKTRQQLTTLSHTCRGTVVDYPTLLHIGGLNYTAWNIYYLWL